MYRRPGLPKSDGSAEVAVLDTIHGADVISEKMVKQGLDARALEVYHHVPDISDFDLIVAPVHLWPGNSVLNEARHLGKKIITHHKAVGELLAENKNFRVFEITGIHSKTSTALILSRILSTKRKVVSHTTRGIELWVGKKSRMIQTGMSITPGNVICAFDAAESLGADDLVSEISLGGTGLADYGILTSFAGDYMIANKSLWASTAKLQMVSLASPGSKLIANVDTKISPDISFGSGSQVRYTLGQIQMNEKRIALILGENFDPQSYIIALSAASAAAFVSGMEPNEISAALEGFDGLSGRMKKVEERGIVVYDNSNSGLKVSGVESALDYARGEGKLGLVTGEESETVCEGMNVPLLVELLKRRRQEIGLLVLVGERLKPYAYELEALIAPDLDTGLKKSKIALKRGDRILSCVKCFR
ncbi:MAG: coenzyme F430 synthase [Methanotrichaceae archaeon]